MHTPETNPILAAVRAVQEKDRWTLIRAMLMAEGCASLMWLDAGDAMEALGDQLANIATHGRSHGYTYSDLLPEDGDEREQYETDGEDNAVWAMYLTHLSEREYDPAWWQPLLQQVFQTSDEWPSDMSSYHIEHRNRLLLAGVNKLRKEMEDAASTQG